jgi:hypothetical protein
MSPETVPMERRSGHRISPRWTDVSMQFFLYEIVARIVAIYLCVDCYRKLRAGFAERRIASWSSDPINWILDSFLDPSIHVARRDNAPIRYWIVIGLQIIAFAGCLGVAIFGWWHPTT